MAHHHRTPAGRAKSATKRVSRTAVAKDAPGEEQRGARIVVLTDDPHTHVTIVPGCRIDSMRQDDNAYFFEDGNELIAMIIEGGTVQYRAADRTYIVRLSKPTDTR